jgi:glycogen debranching enzyme
MEGYEAGVREQLIVLDGTVFFISARSGDVEADAGEGFFYEDVRHLSRWVVRLRGLPLETLTSVRPDYWSARVVSAPALARGAGLTLRRDRFVTEGMHEDVVLENDAEQRRHVRLVLSFAADFADVMEVEDGQTPAGRSSVELGARSLTLRRERYGYVRGTNIVFSRACELAPSRALFRVELAPRSSWRLCVDVSPVVDGRRRRPLLRCGAFGRDAPKMPLSMAEWLDEAPRLEASSLPLQEIYRHSLLDLAALRIRPDDVHIRTAMPGGGIPWFMTVFGRDSLIASYQALPFRHDLARATLEALAELQATEWDDFRDAQPGKILHELRRGTLARTGRIPHTPYYGTHDATPLFLIVLDEYERWTGDAALVRRLEPHARAALAWLEGPADLDGDGFLDYVKRSTNSRALDNHCWKDSDESIRFADGRRAVPPIATCELQGYAYDARLRTARLARTFWGDDLLAHRLEQEAAELHTRFEDTFWDDRRGHYLLALDGRRRRVDALTSNIGHLLWSGIADSRHARVSARQLLSDELFSGWGIRSLSAGDAPYDPLGYHVGCVWPHDSAICAAGLRRYGHDDLAARVCLALVEAADRFGGSLPEVFAGLPRDDARTPVAYPGALRPQAWASGMPLHVLRTLLGLEPHGNRLRTQPLDIEQIGPVGLRGIWFRGSRRDVR